MVGKRNQRRVEVTRGMTEKGCKGKKKGEAGRKEKMGMRGGKAVDERRKGQNSG